MVRCISQTLSKKMEEGERSQFGLETLLFSNVRAECSESLLVEGARYRLYPIKKKL